MTLRDHRKWRAFLLSLATAKEARRVTKVSGDYLEHFEEKGYAIVKCVFGTAEVDELAHAFDRMKAEGAKHRKTFRHGNVLYVVQEDPRLGPILRFLQWPAYINDVLARYRIDRRLLEIVEPLIGNDLKQIINQLIWKPSGSVESAYGYHQDCRFRRPASAYRKLATSYVQMAIAVDSHRPDNGCMKVFPGSQRFGDLGLGLGSSVYEVGLDDDILREKGFDPSGLVDLLLDPGDVALWGPCLVHGSGPNRSTNDRRSYVNGFVIAANCDRGEWAFRNGEPCALGDPVLVQYEDLYERPEPHYVGGSPHPFREE
jgi:ectoine hydroxylase-related dioxygenase (phytanoyl-CoA dioxygenase family)